MVRRLIVGLVAFSIVPIAFSIAPVGCGSSDGGTGEPGEDGGFKADVAQQCEPGVITSISGTVFSPAKSNPDPIYNAAVYIPAGAVEPFHKGVTCEKCGTLGEGTKVKVATLTGPDGKFKIENVTPGENVTLVVQIGRWRRQFKVPKIEACKNTEIPIEATRLPRNHTEGDIPLTAMVTGGFDPLECVLRKIGIDDDEFAAADSPTIGERRIHVFKTPLGADIGGGTISGKSLWRDVNWLKRFDQVLLPCDGGEELSDKTPESMQNLIDYTSAGGRVFTTHYGYVWLKNSPDPAWQKAISWTDVSDFPAGLTGVIEQSFPKGKAMAEWLKLVGASKTLGEIDLVESRIDATASNKPAQTWISSKTPSSPQHVTFNTPIDKPAADQCGRFIYSDFHVVGAEGLSGTIFPAECNSDPLTPQERVIEFMLFDLGSCVQPEGEAPKPPK